MKLVPLTRGKFAMVDDADFEAVSQFKWQAVKRGRCFYAARCVRKPDGKWTIQYMHRFLMPGIAQIDHRDGNGLNNQRKNIRPATTQQNFWAFKRKQAGATSKFRGVSWEKKRLKWEAQIRVDGKNIFLGYFTAGEDAARAFDAAARKYRGEFAHLNFP